jgi:hypothetical protein
MGSRGAGLGLAAALLTGCVIYDAPVTTPAPYPSPAVELPFFYDALDRDGDWIWHDPYGWVWAPNAVTPFWRPYTVGRWVWTDWGWTWVSGEPWGWATYHYGRWSRAPRHGWVWVPGDVWGPGWVAWRRGPGYVGWAPLPPGVRYRAESGLDWDGADIDKAIHVDAWCFLDDARLVEADLHRYVYPVGRNATAIRHARDVTKVHVAGGKIVNEGIDRTQIERSARSPVPARRVVDRPHGELRPATVDRDEVRVYRPQVQPGDVKASPARGIKPAPRAPERDELWTGDDAERTWERGWNQDWQRLQKAQKQDEPPPRKTVAEKKAAPAPPAQVTKQHRDENYEAAENAYRELVAEKERSKRRSERQKPPGQDKNEAPKGD